MSEEVKLLPWSELVMSKLLRAYEHFDDDEDTDIGHEWLDTLAFLGLMRKVMRGRWEITEQGDAAIEAWNTRPTPPAAAKDSWLPNEGAYIIRYDDAEMPDEFFAMGNARETALRRYEQMSLAWNAHLFVKIDSNSKRTEPCPSATPPAADSVAVPGGWKLVPMQLTSAMFSEWEGTKVFDDGLPHERFQACYRAMLAAAPQQAGGLEKAAIPKPQYAYVVGESVIVTGIPQAGFHEESDQYHNCDAMGCGQEHVLYRVPLSRQGDEK